MLIFFFCKIIILMIFAILIRGVLPRMRIDHIIYINWKFFILILIFFLLHLFVLNFIFLIKMIELCIRDLIYLTEFLIKHLIKFLNFMITPNNAFFKTFQSYTCIYFIYIFKLVCTIIFKFTLSYISYFNEKHTLNLKPKTNTLCFFTFRETKACFLKNNTINFLIGYIL